ncbi:MAG: AAA family ATPase [Candidatus Diapherotrites archaeon]|uniref:AAA family ATPase n=1 Tax=Candidatus Iainarchaeum sp. TaxID=3101447 RepID=A0A8T4L953_9ARCH|nr:AAA family ATPase [Candidatus Diapherotrites archaeon]
MRKSSFFVLEGVDGVGKTTVARKISALKGWSYVSTPSAELKQRRSMSLRDDNGFLNLVFYLEAVVDTSARVKKRGKKNIICDRFFPTLVVDAYERKMPGVLRILENISLEKPTLSIHLYADYKTVKKRLKMRSHLTRDEKRLLVNRRFFDSMVSDFRELCDVEIDTSNQTVEQSVNEVLRLVSSPRVIRVVRR